MAKKSEAREIIRIVCTEDGKNYYTTTKNKRNTTERLELKTHNPNQRKYTLHRKKKYPETLMPNPKRRHSHQRTAKRRTHYTAELPEITINKQVGDEPYRLLHNASPD